VVEVQNHARLIRIFEVAAVNLHGRRETEIADEKLCQRKETTALPVPRHALLSENRLFRARQRSIEIPLIFPKNCLDFFTLS
jgi:hypothetical protein